MPQLKTYDLFISHAWAYDDDYLRLVKLLDVALYFKWRNYSVPSHNALPDRSRRGLKGALKRQIRPSNIVLILAGMYATYSDWIEFEMDFATELDKPMIGIRPWGQRKVPQAVINAVDEMVGWQTNSIVSAIRNWSL